MNRREVENRLLSDFEPLVRDRGLTLLDVELASDGRAPVLRATIYKPEGVTLEDCASVQSALSDRLDAADPIAGSYAFEVSSPGLERTLRRDKEFDIFKGRRCQANLFAPVDGKRVFVGDLVGLEKDETGKEMVALDTPQGLLRLERSNVSKVKLVYGEGRDL